MERRYGRNSIVYTLELEVEVELKPKNIKLISSLITMKMKTFVIYKTFVRCVFLYAARSLPLEHYLSFFVTISDVPFYCSFFFLSLVLGDNSSHSFDIFTCEHNCTLPTLF